MKNNFYSITEKTHINTLFQLLIFCCICNLASAQKIIPVEGMLFERKFQTTVDCKLAQTMLVNRNDSSVIELFSNYSNRKINTEMLSEITKKYSADVSTLFFIEKIYEQEQNKNAQNYYLSVLDTLVSDKLKEQLFFLDGYYIVFVPGFRYDYVKGANFLDQRLLLDSAGIPCEMINIEERGLMEKNAQIVANRLEELSKLYNNIIVISVSKGGLETAIALEMLANDENISSIKAWVNVCGILKGSPVADIWLPPIKRWWLSYGLFLMGKRKNNLKSLLSNLSYNRCKEKYGNLEIPAQIITVNLIAVPLGKQKKNTKIPLPNDGLSPLSDSITENGLVIMEVGLDHYLRGVNLNSRMAVILNYTLKLFKKA